MKEVVVTLSSGLIEVAKTPGADCVYVSDETCCVTLSSKECAQVAAILKHVADTGELLDPNTANESEEGNG